jgi:hypothetical protein
MEFVPSIRRSLNPEETIACSFLVTVPGLSVAADVIVLGRPVVAYSQNLGDGGVYSGEVVTHSPPKRLSDSICPIKVQCVGCPRQVMLGEPFSLLLRLQTLTAVPANRFQLRREDVRQKGIVGLGSLSVNVSADVQPSSPIDVPVDLCCVAPGELSVDIFHVFDQVSGARYNISTGASVYCKS